MLAMKAYPESVQLSYCEASAGSFLAITAPILASIALDWDSLYDFEASPYAVPGTPPFVSDVRPMGPPRYKPQQF